MRSVCTFLLLFTTSIADAESPPWVMHTIDDASQGADGVRLADVDGDGLQEVVTGWEEGGVIRVCRNPGAALAKEKWPSVEVGRVKSPEDAVLVDVDGDGAMDVISCCEGKTRTVFVHWAPSNPQQYWDSTEWTTQAIPVTEDLQMWMYCLPLVRKDQGGQTGTVSLIVGSKGPNASVSRLEPGVNPRDVSKWQLQPLTKAGWIMSLRSVDLDGDGDQDVLFSDRKQQTRGVKWLENTDQGDGAWPVHVIGGTDREVMFLDAADLDSDGHLEVVVPTRQSGLHLYQRTASKASWETHVLPMPAGAGAGKAVAVGDIDGNGRADLVLTCGLAEGKHGVFWMSSVDSLAGPWTMHPISGRERGVKFDRIELIDLDADGDLDVMTCEERDNLGVIWYENPTRQGGRDL